MSEGDASCLSLLSANFSARPNFPAKKYSFLFPFRIAEDASGFSFATKNKSARASRSRQKIIGSGFSFATKNNRLEFFSFSRKKVSLIWEKLMKNH